MELYCSGNHFIIVDGNDSLWIHRKNGSFEAKTEDSEDFLTTSGAACLGIVYGFLGKLHLNDGVEPRLVFIQKRSKVGHIKGNALYRICSIVTVPIESESELVLEPCTKCHTKNTFVMGSPKSPGFTPIEPISGGGPATNQNSTTLQKVKACPAASHGSKILSFSSAPRRSSDRSDKMWKRIVDEFHKMFTEAESFFYSTTYDITNSVQRQFIATEKLPKGTSKVPLWKQADSRFFWNNHLLRDLIAIANSNDNTALDPMDRWIVPIIQGFIQYETCDVSQFEMLGPEMSGNVDMCLISRRSVHRAGTRYRRGIDEFGKVANYVESEQILLFKGHLLSFVQVRGSIPLYWSQPGFKYRPPPRLEKTDEDNIKSFTKHLDEEQSIYGPITIINLVEKGGKEKVLGDAYLDNVIKYNSEGINYFAYDFHECCRGMRFENVATLVDKLANVLKNMNYCWVDSYGIVLKQDGVCRVNCVDCLDRTNVVQTHLSKFTLIVQLSKLGLLVPDFGLPNNIKSKLQILWANNGDTISKQYAGTNALKGDFTRTGERRLAGVMKDGMNSANRYYLNRFKDTSRQAAIDVFLGMKTNITEEDVDGEKTIPDEKENTAEQLQQVIDDVKRKLLHSAKLNDFEEFDVILGSWGMINSRTNDPESLDIDTIFTLTDTHYYVTEYDCMLDALTEIQKVPLSAIENIEIGYEPISQTSNLPNIWSIFHSSNSASIPKGIPNIRLTYEQSGQKLFHQFRSSNVRFFNNVIITVNHNPDEMLESLKMFAEAIEAAASAAGKNVTVTEIATLPVTSKDTSRRMPAIAPSWVHRYFSGSSNEAELLNNKTYAPTDFVGQNSQQDKSKFYRRSSLVTPPTELITTENKIKGNGDVMGSEIAGSVDDIDIQLSLSTKTAAAEHKNIPKLTARTPVEGYRSFLVPTKDLVLSSCGIVSVHDNNITTSLSALLSAHELIIDVDGLASPVTPTAPFPHDFLEGHARSLAQHTATTPMDDTPVILPSSNNNLSITEAGGAILHRHRHSLPTNSLSLSPVLPLRSITPEIKITEEEEPSGTGEESLQCQPANKSINGSKPLVTASRLSVIPKRMTRSSEDVNKIASPGNSSVVSRISSTFSGGNFNLNFGRLSPTISDENRSTSDLDISNPTNKKDMVFKFAKNIGATYLDPRKLKVSGIKIMSSSKKSDEQKDEMVVLKERIKNCRSLIVLDI